MKDLITTNENEIGRWIGSSAYQNNSHPDHKSIHQKVTDWFAFQYGRQPVQTDATGKMIAPLARKTSFFVSQVQQGNTLDVVAVGVSPSHEPDRFRMHERPEGISDTYRLLYPRRWLFILMDKRDVPAICTKREGHIPDLG